MPLTQVQDEQPWYAEGLNFKCTECGKCCTGTPGYTWVSDEEIASIATFLNKTIEQVVRQYLRLVNGRFSLLECQKSYDCVFFKDKKCQIYPVRPSQCRTYPFWIKNLRSKEAWDEAARHCEGIRPDAPLIKKEEMPL